MYIYIHIYIAKEQYCNIQTRENLLKMKKILYKLTLNVKLMDSANC